MSPAVTIVVPTYNSGPWLAETLGSVVRQTYADQDMELIVVDDGSRDNSASIARSVIRERSIRGDVLEHQRNLGVSAARNTGWRIAKGEWIQFLDADDILAPHKIQLHMDCALGACHDIAVIYSSWQKWALENSEWRPSGAVNEPIVDANPLVRILQEQSFGYVGPTLIRKAALASIAGFDEQLSIGEDLDVMLRLAMSGGRFRGVASDGPAVFYRQAPGSLWQRAVAQPGQMRRLLRSVRRVEEFLRAQNVHGDVSEEVAHALASRYSAFGSFVQDPDTLRDVARWVEGLGLTYSPDLSQKMRLISRWIGWYNALRLRSSFRRLVPAPRGSTL